MKSALARFLSLICVALIFGATAYAGESNYLVGETALADGSFRALRATVEPGENGEAARYSFAECVVPGDFATSEKRGENLNCKTIGKAEGYTHDEIFARYQEVYNQQSRGLNEGLAVAIGAGIVTTVAAAYLYGAVNSDSTLPMYLGAVTGAFAIPLTGAFVKPWMVGNTTDMLKAKEAGMALAGSRKSVETTATITLQDLKRNLVSFLIGIK